MRVCKESGLLVVRHSIVEVSEQTLLVAGVLVPEILEEKRVNAITEQVAEILKENPDKTIPVPEEELRYRILSGASAVVVGVDRKGNPSDHLLGFASMKIHYPEGGEALDPSFRGDITNAIEAGSMLGNGVAASRVNRVLGVPHMSGQGSRAMEAVSNIAGLAFPERTVIAITGQQNEGGRNALLNAGGRLIGTKPTERLRLPEERMQEGPFMVDIYQMHPTRRQTMLVR